MRQNAFFVGAPFDPPRRIEGRFNLSNPANRGECFDIAGIITSSLSQSY